jgi:hypothetical protein
MINLPPQIVLSPSGSVSYNMTKTTNTAYSTPFKMPTTRMMRLFITLREILGLRIKRIVNTLA